MADASIDGNNTRSLLAVSSADGSTPIKIWGNPTTHRLLVDTGSSAATATTWTTTGNTNVVTDATVTTSSIVVFMYATSPIGFWSVVCGSGTFTITSSDSESAGLGFTYKVFS
jgi:hypothetical protein